MEFKKRLITGLALGTLVASTLLPAAAFADTNVDISGNGVNSTNGVNVTNNNTNTIEQTSVTFVGAYVSSSANTGGNKESGNTGGNNTIDTGNATANSSVNVTAGGNVANLTSNCECNTTPNTTVNVTDNGVGSHNTSNVTNKNSKKVTQKSVTIVLAAVKSKAKTGNNKAKNNTGGDNQITTGASNSNSSLDVTSAVNAINP